MLPDHLYVLAYFALCVWFTILIFQLISETRGVQQLARAHIQMVLPNILLGGMPTLVLVLDVLVGQLLTLSATYP